MENINVAAEVVTENASSFFGSVKNLAKAAGGSVVNVVKAHPVAATAVVVGGTAIVLGRKKIKKVWGKAKAEVEKQEAVKKAADKAAATEKAKQEAQAADKAAAEAATKATEAAAKASETDKPAAAA